jgi:hypothetical protein
MKEFFTIIALVILFAALIWWYNQYEYNQLLRWYATRTEPLIVWSLRSNDQFVEVRAERHRQMLREAKNKWDIPVYSYPYADLKHTSPKFIDFELEYPIKLGEFATLVKNQWSIKIKGADEHGYSEHILLQVPPK